jgi:thiol-disulfide isomerase/thioredoxin
MATTPARRAARGAVLASLGAALIACLSFAPPARAEDRADSHPVLREFQRTGKYVFVGRPAAATRPAVYFSPRAACYMVRGSAYGDPLLMRTGTSSVEAVAEDTLIVREDGSCDVRRGAETKPLGTFSLVGSEIVVSVPGLEGRLTPTPPLLGWHDAAGVTEKKPEYAREAGAYRPDPAAVAKLRGLESKIQVFVYFGTWCHTCNSVMGRILKLEQELTKGRTNVTFAYYGLAPPPQMYEDPEVKLRVIKSLPTGIVYVNDQYAGGIVSTAWAKSEQSLLQLLTAVKAR